MTIVKFAPEDTTISTSGNLMFHNEAHHHDELCTSSENELESMKDSLRDSALHFLIADINKSNPNASSFRPISPLSTKLNPNPLSFSAPIPRPHFVTPTRECSTPIAIPSTRPITPTFSPCSFSSASSTPYFTPSKSLPTTPVTPSSNSSLLKKFYDLVKYVNVPDVLHGLENFGYLSSDQSIELFECLMQLRREFPELARVLQYDAGDRPVCTVQHKGVTCNSCLATDITGTRYKCAICPDFDMCEKCERKGILTHDITHPRIKMLVPSACAFEHTCKPHTHNSQGEKNDPCPFAIPSPVEVTHINTSTYEKRQHQFTTLMQRKQIREAMRKMYLEEEARQRQEEERIEQQKREKEEAERREKEEQERKNMQEEKQVSFEPGQSILSSYFDNLRKQNKLQPIIDNNSSIPEPTPHSPSPSSSFSTPFNAIAVSGSLGASNSSLGQVTNVLADSTTSTGPSVPSSPLALSSSSLSPPTSPPLPRSSTLLKAPSISSRLQQQKCLVFESPDNSPMLPRPNFASPIRESKLKYSSTIEQSDDEEVSEIDYESESSNASSTTQSEQSDLTDILREIGILHSSSETPQTPKKSGGKDFFSSLRDLLR